MFVKTGTSDLQKKIQEVGADRRTVNIYSSQLGQKSAGLNSFLFRICEAICDFSPQGIKFSDMRGYETKKQKCQIKYEGGLGWGSRLWPLE